MSVWTVPEADIAHPTKIATCCYCGTRAALVLTGRDRHELACSSCAAPLHNLKMLPKQKKKAARASVRDMPMRDTPLRSKKKPKKRKSKLRRFADMFEDAFDIIEDILD